jgi:hypothetical protein
MSSITTLTFFRFSSLSQKVWAFSQMQFAHAQIAGTPGLLFYKLLGSGRELGFSPLPDWSVYAMLGVWENEQSANHFLTHADVYTQYKNHSIEQWAVFLKTRQVKGLWSGGNPFSPSPDLDADNPLFAVITRATIRTSKLIKFWRYVPTSQRPIQNGCEGLIYTKGIGEAPLVQMATFSLWENMEALKKYAYKSPEHQVAIQKTRQIDWYKEEMFVRFQPYKSLGTWGGVDILSPYLKNEV